MPELPVYHIDAFTSRIFSGNPAAVCPLEEWIDDRTMAAIAAENNLSETAFFVPGRGSYALRWFAPAGEVKLCGHATLATAFVLFTELGACEERLSFETRHSGTLHVTRDGERLVMDFPAHELKPVQRAPAALIEGLGATPAELHVVTTDDNFFAVFGTEDDVRALTPDFSRLETLHPAGVVATAPGRDSDCASRYFAPSYGIPEDPVTGSIHCGLAPYWAARLGRPRIRARQVSARGGELYCEDRGDRVTIAGHAVKYMQGTLSL
jgi:PhzF family phenazine biosynthesis protein